jgi:Histidine kinase
MSDFSATAADASKRLSTNAVRWFHVYANWLVGITWKRFIALSVLLLILANVLASLPPFTRTITEVNVGPSGVRVTKPSPPSPPSPPSTRGAKDDTEVNITIDKNGVRISPRSRAAASAASAAADTAASAASAATSAAASAASGVFSAGPSADGGVQINLPPGATSEAVKQAVEEARQAVVEAIEESRRAAADAAEEARQAARTAAEEARDAAEEARDASESAGPHTRTIRIRTGESLPGMAFLFIVASAILKATYKGRLQAEVKAAAATETAESEQLKRQVVEARMAAMQAQVEPHFLFNTLASIDHLIETDPARASTMQKNLIALLRASMPTMRENHPAAHNLGREMAVIRPYLEILKVRMEDRLQTEINVPEGLLSADFPSMMIQSLVENAIKHGLEPKPEGGLLSVRAEIVHGKLAVTVADTGLGFGKAATAGTGIGLNNIRERLQLLYGNKASMTVAENPPSGTLVTLTVPYQAQPREGDAA